MSKIRYKSIFPGENLLRPKIYETGFLLTKPLLLSIKSAIDINLKNKLSLKLIDIACGTKPYYPLFKDIVSDYIGIDIKKTEYSDVIADAADLPFDDESFDIVLSTQALEHIKDYQSSVNEMHRVLKKDGLVLLSTHGVMEIHGAPNDYWRFTKYGLLEVFKNFEKVDVIPNGASILCFFMYLNTYLRRLKNVPILNLFVRILITINNVLGLFLDRFFTKYDFYVANYLVVATK